MSDSRGADPLSADALRDSPLVASLELHGELGSTNDRAKELAHQVVSLPALVVADRQTAGRGRGANRWHASTGSLTLSLLIDPAGHGLTIDHQGLLAIAAGVAVIDTAREVAGITAGLKWPNDVLVGGKKLAGVLIEAPRPDRWVVGVGINVSNRFETAPPEVATRATSLNDAAETAITRQAALEAFLNAFHERLPQPSAEADGLLTAARKACVLTDREVTVLDGQNTVTGRCRGVADDGSLLVQTDGAAAAFRSGSVRLP